MTLRNTIRAHLASILDADPTCHKTQDGYYVADMPMPPLTKSEREHAEAFGIEDVYDIRYSKFEEKKWREVARKLRRALPKAVSKRVSPEELHDEFVYEMLRIAEPVLPA